MNIIILFLYNLFLWLIKRLLPIVSLFNKKVDRWVLGRKNIFQNLENSFRDHPRPVVWIHCASLGEFEQGRPLIEKINTDYPNYKILLTFFSPSGYEIRKNYPQADWVYYLPLDTYNNARRFLDITKPILAIFVKYEFWYHFISQLKNRNIPIYSVSAIFRASQLYFKPYGYFSVKLLTNFDHIFVQNFNSQTLLQSVNISSTISGDTRFDRVIAISKSILPISIIEAFKQDHSLIVIGSSWKEDLIHWAAIVKQLFVAFPTIKLVIAPHQISERDLAQIESIFEGVPVTYFSKKQFRNERILIVDNIGLLSSIYSYADFAYIGGAFGKGLHNILEAAVYGIPVIFGPNYQKFDEAVLLIEEKGGFSVSNQSELFEIVRKLATDLNFRSKTAQIAKKFVMNNAGATEIIMNRLAPHFYA